MIENSSCNLLWREESRCCWPSSPHRGTHEHVTMWLVCLLPIDTGIITLTLTSDLPDMQNAKPIKNTMKSGWNIWAGQVRIPVSYYICLAAAQSMKVQFYHNDYIPCGVSPHAKGWNNTDKTDHNPSGWDSRSGETEGGEGSRGELNDQKGLSAFHLFSYLKDEGWGQISDTLTGLLPLFQHH